MRTQQPAPRRSRRAGRPLDPPRPRVTRTRLICGLGLVAVLAAAGFRLTSTGEARPPVAPEQPASPLPMPVGLTMPDAVVDESERASLHPHYRLESPIPTGAVARWLDRTGRNPHDRLIAWALASRPFAEWGDQDRAMIKAAALYRGLIEMRFAWDQLTARSIERPIDPESEAMAGRWRAAHQRAIEAQDAARDAHQARLAAADPPPSTLEATMPWFKERFDKALDGADYRRAIWELARSAQHARRLQPDADLRPYFSPPERRLLRAIERAEAVARSEIPDLIAEGAVDRAARAINRLRWSGVKELTELGESFQAELDTRRGG